MKNTETKLVLLKEKQTCRNCGKKYTSYGKVMLRHRVEGMKSGFFYENVFISTSVELTEFDREVIELKTELSHCGKCFLKKSFDQLDLFKKTKLEVSRFEFSEEKGLREVEVSIEKRDKKPTKLKITLDFF